MVRTAPYATHYKRILVLGLLGPLLSLQPLTRSRRLRDRPHYILEDPVLPILLGGDLLPRERCWTGMHLQRFCPMDERRLGTGSLTWREFTANGVIETSRNKQAIVS